jgi:(1->4)-alpha-D-glucan 1-alpha-D-glucosylmutase
MTTSRPRIPRATYRLQLHRDFTFQDAARVVPYLAALGISHLYSSPILKARAGSTHGYDVIDHTMLNPELGTRADFEHLVAVLHAHQMGLLVDIVPNHLGVMGADNVWWLDLLENGPSSQYAQHFDIDWRPLRASLRNRVLVPILGQPYGTVLERGELRLDFEPGRGAFQVRYHENCLPIDPREYPRIFSEVPSALAPDDPDRADFESLLTAFAHLPPRDVQDPEALAIRRRDKEAHKRRLVRLIERSIPIQHHIQCAVERLNGKPGVAASFDALDALLDAQAYRLAYWRVAVDEINYRRFFDINDLAALRMNEAAVFECTHQFILQLVQQGCIDGLRIDHSDGLFDPQGYFEHLQGQIRAAPGSNASCYVLTEKILATHERLPSAWQIQGTTGYDFAVLATSWLVQADAELQMSRIYRHFSGVTDSFEQIAHASRKLVMRVSLAAEVEVLATQLDRLAQLDRHTADFTRAAMREAIIETIACFPVYRTYITERGVSDDDRRNIHWAINVARRRSAAAELSVFDFLRDVLLGDAALGRSTAHVAVMLEFAMKFQQVTSPVVAKGIEDTAFYRYCNLVCLNEVGGDPRRWSVSNAALHQENLERARHWPHSMLAGTTHDTKRSEDVRARIAVLSELPERWRRHLARWSRLNRDKRKLFEGGSAPSRNDEYLIYQTLLGIYRPDIDAGELLQRLQAYLIKAAREAKVATAWMNPDADYEQALCDFAAALLEKAPAQNAFLHDFSQLAEVVAYFGQLNSLAQTVLKLTAPGVPDLYQGTELPLLALVDPDNRRPVAFDAATRELADLQRRWQQSPAQLLADLLTEWRAGTAKLHVTYHLLQLRREWPALFADGDYQPLQVEGSRRDHVLAFQRSWQQTTIVVVVTRWLAKLMQGTVAAPVGEVWQDTVVHLTTPLATRPWHELLSAQPVELAANGELRVAAVLASLPVAVLFTTGDRLTPRDDR